MTWFARLDDRGIVRELRRIADALERIAPEPVEPEDLKPADAVSYVDEERMVQRDLAEEMGKIKQWLETQGLTEDEIADVQRESD